MKRKVWALLLAVVMVLASVPVFASADEGQVEHIVVWSDNAHEQSVRDRQVAEFNETIGKELGIVIDYTVYGTDYADAMQVAMQAEDGPDLFRPSSSSFAGFVQAGKAVPISDLKGSESLLAKYNQDELVVGDQVFDGKVYTLPYSLTSYKMIINQDLFDQAGIKEPPKTWDEVREDAKLITEAANGAAYGYFLALKSGWCQDHYIYSVSAPDMGHFGYDAVSGTYRYADGLPIIKNLLGMIEDGSMFPGFETLDADTARAQFSAGTIGIVMAASFDVAVYTDQFPATCKWVVCDPPAFTEEGYQYKEMVTAVDLLGVTKMALKKDTAKVAKVLEWFYEDENLVEMYEQGMYIPFSTKVVSMAKESDVYGWKEFSTFKDDQIIIRMADPKGMLKFEGLSARETLAKLLSGGFGDEDPEAVLKELDDRLNAAFQALDPEVQAAYIAQPGYTVTREK